MAFLRRLLGGVDRALGTVEHNLKAVYGGAQVDEQAAGTQHQRAEHRLSGVGGDFEVHRDATGRTYLVSKPAAPPAAPPAAERPAEPDDDGGR